MEYENTSWPGARLSPMTHTEVRLVEGIPEPQKVLRTAAEHQVILESADLIKELLADPRNVICVRTAVLLWNAETKLRAMVEAV